MVLEEQTTIPHRLQEIQGISLSRNSDCFLLHTLCYSLSGIPSVSVFIKEIVAHLGSFVIKPCTEKTLHCFYRTAPLIVRGPPPCAGQAVADTHSLYRWHMESVCLGVCLSKIKTQI